MKLEELKSMARELGYTVSSSGGRTAFRLGDKTFNLRSHPGRPGRPMLWRSNGLSAALRIEYGSMTEMAEVMRRHAEEHGRRVVGRG